MKRLPSGKTLGVCLAAIALALWSLPNSPDINSTSDLHAGSSISGGVAPTVAVPVEGQAQPNPSHPQNQAPSRKQPPKAKKPQAQPPKTAKPQAQPPKAPKPPAVERRTTPPAEHDSRGPEQRPPVAPQPPSNSMNPGAPKSAPVDPTEPTNKFSPYVPVPKSQLRIRVIDGRTQRPIEGAEVVLIETEQRFTTGPDGFTPWVYAPILRDPRYRPMVAELHGQLGAIAYRNGYRDSVQLGIRMHEGVRNETTIWMYRLGPGDSRIEPVLYQVPYHRLWLIQLADRFRSKSQPGEGPERP